jgi:hypothetical protein
MGRPDFKDSEIVFLIGEIHFTALGKQIEQGNSLTVLQQAG